MQSKIYVIWFVQVCSIYFGEKKFTWIVCGPFEPPATAGNNIIALKQNRDSIAARVESIRSIIPAVSPNQWGVGTGPIEDFEVIVYAAVV